MRTNESTRSYPELNAFSRKGHYRSHCRYKATAIAVAACFASGAYANPTNPAVVNGAAKFTTAGNLLTITNTPNAIINWGSFSIGANEITRFVQQSASSAVLNRVVGQDPSSILGALQSNGRVFLINPNGILFGAGSQINVGGLVASTMNLSNEDFLAGRMRFTGGLGKNVINQGDISTPQSGNVYLIGNAVTNSGIITSPKGEVVLAAGNSVELVNPGTPDLRVEVVAPSNQALNLGSIVADSGRVGIYAGLINQAGTINANSVVVGENGQITLRATKNVDLAAGSATTANGPSGGKIEVQSGDTTLVSGVVEAKGQQLSLPFGDDVGKGGEIKLLGNFVGLEGNARVDASGESGGGTVLVGGDFQGKNPIVQNAFRTFVGAGASITADAVTSGNGGKVIVWSDDYTVFGGTLTARGGAQSGNGGFAEVSGHSALAFNPKSVQLGAANGEFGTLLLDPLNIIVATGGGAAIANVSTFAASPGTTQTIDPLTLDAVGATVNLQATNDITVTNAINLTTVGAGLIARAGNNINVNAGITTNKGAITLSARDPGTTPTVGGAVFVNAPLSSTDGAITVTNNNGTTAGTVAAAINAGAAAVALNTGTSTTNISANVSGDAISAGQVNFVGGSTETITGTSFTANSISAAAGSNVTLSATTNTGSFAINSATVTLNSDLTSTGTSSLSGTGAILGAGNLDINSGGLFAQFNWNGGTLGGTGTFTTSANITPSLGGGAVTLGRNWTMNSTSGIMSGGPLTINAGKTWTTPVGGAFTLNSSAAAPQIRGGGTLLNNGQIVVTLPSTIGDGTTLFDNLGSVTSTSSSITINASNSAGVKDTGIYKLDGSGTTLTFSGGTRTIASTGKLITAGTASTLFSGGNFTMEAGATYANVFLNTLIDGATVTFDNNVTFDNVLNFKSGILQGAGALSANGGFTWSGGTLQGTGTLSSNGATTLASSGGTLTLDRTLNANTGFALSGAGLNINNTNGNGALNSGDGVMSFSSSIAASAGASPITGGGTFTVNANNALTINAPVLADYSITNFVNKGTVTVASGTVRLVGTGTATDSGSYVNNGAGLVFGAGTRSIAGSISGTGGITFNGAVVTLTGGYTPTGTTTISTALNPASSVTFNQGSPVTINNLQMQNGIVDGSANLTATTLNWTGGTIQTTGAGTLATTNVTIGGAVNLGRNWTLNAGGTSQFNSVPAAAVTIAGGKTLAIASGATLTLPEISTPGAASTPFAGTGTVQVNTGGTLAEFRTGDVAMSTVTFNNNGTVGSTSGNLILGGNSVSEFGTYALGGVTPGTGGTVSVVSGTRTGSGTQVTGFGTVETNGGNWTFTNMAPGHISATSRIRANSGTFTFNDTGLGGTVTADTIEVHAGGTITSTSTPGMSLLTDNLIWDGGTISATGTATLTTQTNPAVLSGSNTMTLGRNWTANSGINFTSTSNLDIAAGKTLTNAGAMTLNTTGATLITGAGTLANGAAGTITSTSTDATISSVFNNAGAVNVNTGKLTIGNGGTEGGNYVVAAPATLGFSAGTRNWSTGGITGAGNVLFSGSNNSTFSIGSPTPTAYNITGSTTVSGGTVTFANTGPALGAFSESGGTTNLNTAATAASANITGGTLTGTGSLTTTGAGALSWTGGTIDNTNLPLIIGGATTVNLGAAAVTLTNTGNDFKGTVSVTNSGAFDVLLRDSNAITLGAITAGKSLDVNATGGITLTGNVTSGTSQGYAQAVTLGANVALTGVITQFLSTVDGPFGLTINDPSAIIFLGNVGGTTKLTSLTTNGLGAVTISGGGISTTGAQTYNGPVTLGNNAVFSGTGVNFANTVNGAQTLLVNDSGATVFGGVVGGTTPLTSLATDAAGTSSSVGAITSGAIAFNDNTTLSGFYSGSSFTANGTTTLAGATTVSPFPGGAATFNGAVNGAQPLTVNTTGVTAFNGMVGGTTPLTSLITDAGGTSSSVGVTTTGATTFNDNTTLNGTYTNTGFTVGGTSLLAGTATTINAGAGNVTFNGFIDGTVAGVQSLTVNSSGATKFLSGFGGGKALASLTTDAGGTSSSVGGTTTGVTQFLDNTILSGTYNNAGLTAGGNTILAGAATTINSGAGAIIFTGTVDGTIAGAQSLTANSTGATTFGGAVGGTALSTLTTNAGGTLALNGVFTTGLQTYGETAAVSLNGNFNTNGTPFIINAPATLAGDTTINAGAGNVTFNNFIDGAVAGGQSLTVNSGGATNFLAGIGGGKSLSALTTDNVGTSSSVGINTSVAISFGDVTSTLSGSYTSNNFNVTGNTLLAGPTTVTTGSGTINFTGTVNGAQALVANTSGLTSFGGLVGNVTPLTSLTTDVFGTTSSVGVIATGPITFNDSPTLSGLYTSSSFLAGGGTNLAGATTVSATGGGSVTFSGGVNGAQSLIVNTTGATTFNNPVGVITPLTSLTTDAGGTSSSVGVTTTGATTFNDNTTLSGTYTNAGFTAGGTTTLAGTATTINAGAGNVTFGNFIDGTGVGAQSLIINSSGVTTLPAGIGGGKALSSLTTDAGGTTLINGPISTTGAMTFNDAVSGNNVTLNAGAGTITAGNPANDFTGTTTLTGSTIQISDANTLTAALTVSGPSTLTAGGNLVVSGSAAGLTTTTTGAGTTTFGATTVTGNLATISAGAVVQSAPLLVSGTTNVNAGVNAITLTNAGNDFGGLATFMGGIVQVSDSNVLSSTLATSGLTTLTAGGSLSVSGSAGGLTTTAGGATDFGATTVSGALFVSSPSGAITQSGPLLVSSTSDFNSGANAITLTNAANNFLGPVTLTGGTVQVTDVNALTASLTASSPSTLNAGGNLFITSANTAGLTTVTTGTGTTVFGTNTNVTGNLAVNSAGNVSQTGPLTVTGNSSINAGSNAISLNNANNDFSGPLSLTGGATQITDKNALTLGTLGIGALTVTSTGALNLGQGTIGGALIAKSNNNAITQAGALTVTGISDINAGNAPITLNNANNDFVGAVSVAGSTVQIADINTLTLGNLGAGSLTVAAANSVVQGALNTSGNFTLPSGILIINPGGSLTTVAANIAPGATLATGGAFTATGPVTVGGILKGSATGPIVASGQPVNVTSGGTLDLNGGTVTTSAVNNQGLLKGVGTINGNVFNDGTFSPGASPGIVNIVGNYVQGPTGLLNIEIGGTTPGSGFDKLDITGNATLNGVLTVVPFGSFVANTLDSYRFLTTGGTINGTFSTIVVPTAIAGISLNYQSQFIDVLASPASAPGYVTNPLIAATQQPILVVEEKKILTEEEKKQLGPSCSP